MIKTWRLDAAGLTAVFVNFDDGVPGCVYLGSALPLDEDCAALTLAGLPNISAGQLDSVAPQTFCALAVKGWQGHPGILCQQNDGSEYLPNFILFDAQEDLDKYAIHWNLLDRSLPDGIQLGISAYLLPKSGLLKLKTSANIPADKTLTWLAAPAISIPASHTRIIDHGGRWCGEFQLQETQFQTGAVVRESREGRTGHAHFPGAVFACADTGEHSGTAIGIALAWSGGHKMIAEQLPDGRRQVQLGIIENGLNCGKTNSQELLVSWSDQGFNGVSNRLHEHLRAFHLSSEKQIDQQRPVHYNCWEAVYFNHNVDKLKDIASRAAELGAERFVLDDGWFKGRNDDTSSLGDWFIDESKFPDGLTPLIEHVRNLGMRFGLWFEPEMINKNSDLYRAHPDWTLGPADQPAGRNQHVLDLSNPAVGDYLFERIDEVLASHEIDYIKWDHNRSLTGGHPNQTHALLALMRKLKNRHPDVSIESCSSGGGRIDFGMLKLTNRVWLSDSNDALERLRMQHEASRWIAPEFQGSHVGPRQCHTSGRILPMPFRAWVAAQRHMGFEMDPREFSDEEAADLKRITNWYRKNRSFMFSGRHRRLQSVDAEVVAEITVASDGSRFVLFRGQAGASKQIATQQLNLAGLEPDSFYQIRLINPEDHTPLLNRVSANPIVAGEPLTLSGRALMNGTLRLPNTFPATMSVIEGLRISK